MLPEKPWRSDAVLRLFASVVLCIFLGSTIDPIVRFFTGPHTVSPLVFAAATIGAMACFVLALVLLNRQWTFENFPWMFGRMVICVFAGISFTWWQMQILGDHK